jgi:phosphopantothenoylcysteine decarboxylase/phosphopantothenate--cysteine ligase
MNIIITAGPTREPIDPVRFFSNYSSGKMGYALARAAVKKGAQVTLISGPTSLPLPPGVKLIKVNTAREMHKAVMAKIKHCDIFIAAAAVEDYRPEKIVKHKVKKTKDSLTIKLVKNPDVLAAVAALPNPPFTVGFAAETEKVLANAKQKLKEKKVNMIIANKVGPKQGFAGDKNQVTILQPNQPPIKLPLANKLIIAQKIIETLMQAKYNQLHP